MSSKNGLVRVPVRVPKLIVDSLKIYNVNLVPDQKKENTESEFKDFLQELLKGGAIILASDEEINPPQQPE